MGVVNPGGGGGGGAPAAHASTHGSGGSDPVTPAAIGAADAAATASALAAKADASATTSALAAKAPLASPALTGNPTVPTQSAGDNSTKAASTAYTDAAVAASNRLPATTQASTYTFVLADAGTVVESTSATGVTWTVPLNSSVAFPVGTIIEVCQYGAGQVTLAPAGGVTLRFASSLTSRAQYSTVVLRKRATDEWVVGGDAT